MRWLLLDKVVSIEKGHKVVSESKIPDTSVSREFLMLEMMAQTGGLLIGSETEFRENLIFAKVENAEFSLEMVPGALIRIEASAENMRPDGAWIDSQIYHEKNKVASARMLIMSAGNLVPGVNKSITFHDAFMDHFKIREKIVAQ